MPTDTYTSAGSYTWTCPGGVSLVNVELWAAGGGGGGGLVGAGSGGGGGAGALATKTNFPVTPGVNYDVVVGQGGPGGIEEANGGNGGQSYFKDYATCSANGGDGGGGYPGSMPGAGGTVGNGTTTSAGNPGSGTTGGAGTYGAGSDGGILGPASNPGGDGYVGITYEVHFVRNAFFDSM